MAIRVHRDCHFRRSVTCDDFALVALPNGRRVLARDLNGWIVDIRSLLSLRRRGCGQCLCNGPGRLEHCISHYRWAACGDRGSGFCLVRVDSCASKPERTCSDQVVIVGVGRGRASRTEVEFCEDVAYVAGYGLFADVELVRDTAVGDA